MCVCRRVLMGERQKESIKPSEWSSGPEQLFIKTDHLQPSYLNVKYLIVEQISQHKQKDVLATKMFTV